MTTDDELVGAALAGDVRAFALLLERHERRLRAVVGRLLGGSETDDVVQETFLQAYLGLAELRRRDRFGSWLCGIGVNLAKMRLRRRRDLALPLDRLAANGSDEVAEAVEVTQLVQQALEVLPAQERDAVLRHYVQGLSAREIAALRGERSGTVRVRLHRARRRLRGRLEFERREERAMVEVMIQDVVVRLVENEGETRLVNERQRIVLLRERDGERVLPIWVGPDEGDALTLQLAGDSMPRPMTVDLMKRLLDVAGARVERVIVSALRETTFYATIVLEAAGASHEVDARPSDALNLAARARAPIFVDESVMEGGFTGEVGAGLEREAERWQGPEFERTGEWRSSTPELVKSLREWLPPKR